MCVCVCVCASVLLCTDLQKYGYLVAFLDFVSELHCGYSEDVSRLHVVMLVIFAVTVDGYAQTARLAHPDRAWRISLLQLRLM